MSDEPAAPTYEMRAFYGPRATADAAKAAMEADGLVNMLPAAGEASSAVDEDGEDGMFALALPTGFALPVPAGLREASRAMVARMVGSSF